MNCVVCGISFDIPMGEATIGMGDGTGQKFGHSSCYWRKRAELFEGLVRRARNKGNDCTDFEEIFCEMDEALK